MAAHRHCSRVPAAGLHRRPRLFARAGAGSDDLQGAQGLEARESPSDDARRAAIGGRPIEIPARHAIARSRNLQSDGGGGGRGLRAIARHRPRRAIGAVSDGDRLLRRHPHADWRARRHHRRQLGRDGSRHPLHDAIFRADQRRLGPRRLGQDPAHHRSRCVVGAGQRRRPRQRQTVGASPARHRLFQPARGRFTARSPAPLRRAVPRNLRDHAQQIQSRLRAQRHDGDNQRRRGAGPIASSGHRSPGTERRRAAGAIRACHRGSDRQAPGRADDRTALTGL